MRQRKVYRPQTFPFPVPRLTAMSWDGWRNSIHFGRQLSISSTCSAYACANSCKLENWKSEATQRETEKTAECRKSKPWDLPAACLITHHPHHTRHTGSMQHCSAQPMIMITRSQGLPRWRGTAPVVRVRYRAWNLRQNCVQSSDLARRGVRFDASNVAQSMVVF